MEKFARRSYFGYIIEGMKGLGYGLLANVEIRADELRYGYHVPVISARSTRLFFARPGRALIAQMNFTEILGVDDEGYSFSVGGNLYANCYDHETNFEDYCNWVKAQQEALARQIGYEAMRERRLSGWMPELPYGIGHVGDSINGGDWTTSVNFDRRFQDEYGWRGKFLYQLPTNEIVGKLHELCEPTFLLLARKFDRLGVTSFPPIYTFLESERPFWSKFPFGRLKTMVSGRIYGSDFPWLPERREPTTGLLLHPLYRGPYVR